MGSIKKLIEDNVSGVYVHSLEIGNGIIEVCIKMMVESYKFLNSEI